MEMPTIKYPADVASEFFNREEQDRRSMERLLGPSTPVSPGEPLEGPTHAILTQLIETMLFASMATEEGHLTPVGIVFAESLAPFQAKQPAWAIVRFATGWSFDAIQIAKFASACGSLESLLIVVPQEEKLAVVGIATPHSRGFLQRDKLVRVLSMKPGVISIRRDEVEIVRYDRGRLRPRHPSPIGSPFRGRPFRAQLDSIGRMVFRGEPERHPIDVGSFLLRIVKEMIRLGHGGLLAVLGPNDEPGSLLDGAKQLAAPLQLGTALLRLYDAQLVDQQNTVLFSLLDDTMSPPTQEASDHVTRLIEQIARLTTVDGAVVMTHSLDVIAFGAKLPSKENAPKVFSVNDERRPGESWPLDTRGTRHRAAAIFAQQHAQGLAFIVSQDGDAAILQHLESEVVHWPLSL